MDRIGGIEGTVEGTVDTVARGSNSSRRSPTLYG